MNGLRSGSVMVRPGEGLAAIPLETRHFEDLGRYLLEPMTERVRVAQQHARAPRMTPSAAPQWAFQRVISKRVPAGHLDQ